MDLLRQSAEPGWWVSRFGTQLPQQWQALIDYERRATALYNYESIVLPGLLQTAAYARAVIDGTADASLTSDELDAKVSARLGRQGILSRSKPPVLSVLIHEPALRLPVGGPEVMRRQLLHLVEMSERADISIDVVPLSAGPHAGLDGSFIIMDMTGEPSVVYQESKTRNAFLERDDLEIYRLAWKKITSVALGPDAARNTIVALADEYAQLSDGVIMNLAGPPARRWRKSSFSGSATNCVEIARLAEDVGVRDSKNPEFTLTFARSTFAGFLRRR